MIDLVLINKMGGVWGFSTTYKGKVRIKVGRKDILIGRTVIGENDIMIRIRGIRKKLKIEIRETKNMSMIDIFFFTIAKKAKSLPLSTWKIIRKKMCLLVSFWELREVTKC